MDIFEYVPDVVAGTVMFFAGLILLLDTLGILQEWLHTAIIVIAIGMMIYGFFKGGFASIITSWFKGNKNEPPRSSH